MLPKRCCTTLCATTPRKRCPIFRALFSNNTLGGGCNLFVRISAGKHFSIVRFIRHWGLGLMLQFVVLSKGGAVCFAQLVWGCMSMLQFDCKLVASLHRNWGGGAIWCFKFVLQDSGGCCLLSPLSVVLT